MLDIPRPEGRHPTGMKVESGLPL